MKTSVIIPSYRRPACLQKCLNALENQSVAPEEIIVVLRKNDIETVSMVKRENCRAIYVNSPGQVAALNTGLDNALGDIIAITDDDAVPHKDWIKLIERHFRNDNDLAGLGGKDNLYIDYRLLRGKKRLVGKIRWFGSIVGNHHLGYGRPREVDHLKGVNMSFRKEAIKDLRFDKRLRGLGAQVRNDTAFCLQLKRKGAKLVYDPEVVADHFQAPRFERDKRGNFDYSAVLDGAFNETLVLLEYLPFFGKICHLFFALLTGNIFTPGLIQFIRILPREKKDAVHRFLASLEGRKKAILLTWIK